eukprot:257013_1
MTGANDMFATTIPLNSMTSEACKIMKDKLNIKSNEVFVIDCIYKTKEMTKINTWEINISKLVGAKINEFVGPVLVAPLTKTTIKFSYGKRATTQSMVTFNEMQEDHHYAVMMGNNLCMWIEDSAEVAAPIEQPIVEEEEATEEVDNETTLDIMEFNIISDKNELENEDGSKGVKESVQMDKDYSSTDEIVNEQETGDNELISERPTGVQMDNDTLRIRKPVQIVVFIPNKLNHSGSKAYTNALHQQSMKWRKDMGFKINSGMKKKKQSMKELRKNNKYVLHKTNIKIKVIIKKKKNN